MWRAPVFMKKIYVEKEISISRGGPRPWWREGYEKENLSFVILCYYYKREM